MNSIRKLISQIFSFHLMYCTMIFFNEIVSERIWLQSKLKMLKGIASQELIITRADHKSWLSQELIISSLLADWYLSTRSKTTFSFKHDKITVITSQDSCIIFRITFTKGTFHSNCQPLQYEPNMMEPQMKNSH